MRSLVLLLAATAIAVGQSSSGLLTGEIHDPSGALVEGVRITAVQKQTGFERTVSSTSVGQYTVSDLAPGIYTVRAEKAGFSAITVEWVAVELNQKARLDLELALGDEHTTVTVSTPVSAVQTADASEGYQLPNTATRALPLGERNLLSLVTLGPGAIPRQLGGFGHDIANDVQAARGAVAWNPPVNGARSTANVYLLDGIYNTDRTVFVIAVNPLMESIEDFRVLTSLAPAEYAQNGGAVVNMVTRSGAARFHGSAFEFLRNDATDAHSFFDDAALPPSLFRQNQFGGSLGGPLGHGRTFFHGVYEGLRNRTAKSSLHLLPDATFRSGDLSAANPIFDPSTLDSAGNRQPFPGNRIPAARIDPIARSFLDKFQPLPNRAPGGQGNYLDATPNESSQDDGSIRIDHQFQNQGRLFGRYTLNNAHNVIAGAFPERPTREELHAQQVALGYTINGAYWLNEARISFTRLNVASLPRSAFQNDGLSDLGISGFTKDPAYYGLPSFVITDFETVVDNATRPQLERNNTWYAADGISGTRGRHNWKAGVQWLHFQLNYLQSQMPRGQYILNGTFTTDPKHPDGTGEPFGDFLLGFPQITRRSVGSPQAYLRQEDIGVYVQDDWRLTSNLTLNLGLRYEYASPYTEQRGNLLNLDYSTLPRAPRLVQVSTPSAPDRNNFAPRIGFAWRLPGFSGASHDTVLRGGYGIYYAPEIAAEAYDLIRNTLRNEENQTNGLTPVLTLANGFPSTASTGFPSYYGLDANARTPYVQQWTVSLQRDVGRGVVAEMAYLGTKGTKLGRFRRFNTPLQVETGANLGPRPGDLQSLRTFPELGPIFQRQHIANSNYQSLLLRVEKRYRQGLGLLASFVWAKSIDDADSILPGVYESFGAQDERNLRLERGLSFFDVRKRLSAGFVYDFPAPKRFTWLLSAWRTSGILTFQDGTPLNPVYFGTDIANSGTPNRPDTVSGQQISLPKSQRTIERYFNTDAFATPAPYTFGNAGRNVIPGPGNEVVDISLQRRIRLRESAGLEFRVDALNLFNHPNVGIPGPYPDFGPFFGRIFSTGEPRRLQFGLRLDF